MKRSFLSSICFMALGIHSAQANELEQDFLNTFAQCDASLFTFLQNNQQHFQKYAPIQKHPHGSIFTVKPMNEEIRAVAFKQPMQIQKVKVYGFETSYMELDFSGTQKPDSVLKAYFWELNLGSQSIHEVARKWPQLNLINLGKQEMVGLTQIIPNTQKSLTWQPNSATLSGVAPAKGSAEKALVLHIGENGQTRLSCTVQGYMPPKMIKELHLDILESRP